MKKFELVFIPMPGMGHLVSSVEMANILLTRDPRLAVTVLAIKIPFDEKASQYIQSLSASTNQSLRFIVLPEPPSLPQDTQNMTLQDGVDSYKPQVRETVTKLINDSSQIVGFVLDMFCTAMIDVAKEFEVPCYVFYTSGAGYLDFSLHLQEIYSQNDGNNEVVVQLQNSDVELGLLSFVNPVPAKVIPGVFSFEKIAVWLHDQAKKIRSETKGVLINTFVELESHVLKSMSSRSDVVPKLYPVGPILQLKKMGSDCSVGRADILKWLDDQPSSSVVFLCFGSRGSFEEDQVEEIALALERSGLRFVWSLRRPPLKAGIMGAPSDYADFKNVLPKGFLDRTSDVGRVIGWAPQVEILAHPATGGFVSHCGWNSTLESIWHGVPMATWPMYAEQQFNAFEMVVELGLAVEITLDYRNDFLKNKPRIVSAEEIESGIRKLMDADNEIRKKVKAKSEESRKAVMEGGSSFVSLGHFIDDVLALWEESK